MKIKATLITFNQIDSHNDVYLPGCFTNLKNMDLSKTRRRKPYSRETYEVGDKVWLDISKDYPTTEADYIKVKIKSFLTGDSVEVELVNNRSIRMSSDLCNLYKKREFKKPTTYGDIVRQVKTMFDENMPLLSVRTPYPGRETLEGVRIHMVTANEVHRDGGRSVRDAFEIQNAVKLLGCRRWIKEGDIYVQVQIIGVKGESARVQDVKNTTRTFLCLISDLRTEAEMDKEIEDAYMCKMREIIADIKYMFKPSLFSSKSIGHDLEDLKILEKFRSSKPLVAHGPLTIVNVEEQRKLLLLTYNTPYELDEIVEFMALTGFNSSQAEPYLLDFIKYWPDLKYVNNMIASGYMIIV